MDFQNIRTTGSVYEAIQGAIEQARYTKDKEALSVFQYLVGEVSRQRTVNTSDSAVVPLVRKVQKRLVESVEQGATPEIQLTYLNSFIDAWLPKQATAKELEAMVNKAIEHLGDKANIGSVMKLLKQTNVPFDARFASTLIKEKLA
ncbi:hypothetical protein VspSw1_77 [Vibrio phage VspSw_1]|uniref:GatB/YqeY domain-containing protein n=1 Tax=Vibrio phage VspSw_1 TaxID=2484249 RepID=A0A411BKQ8_9CAUD|nr:hypothetical protein HOV08_gp077 [Vibrio phage VspSw_1]QAY02149.1 hypothetical protein VspSw1_77 [Vibrio phage VspSw_1]